MNRSIERQRKAIRNEGKRILRDAQKTTVPKWREFCDRHGWHWPKIVWQINHERTVRRAMMMAKANTKTILKVRSKYAESK